MAACEFQCLSSVILISVVKIAAFLSCTLHCSQSLGHVPIWIVVAQIVALKFWVSKSEKNSHAWLKSVWKVKKQNLDM